MTKSRSASITRDVEQALAAGNVSVKVAVSEALLGEAISGHVYIFIVALMMISTVMAVVGGLGLMSSMGTSVIERTREFGVMRAIGAKSKTILRNIISEGVFIGLISWVIALPLSIPLSLGIGYLIGMMSFRSPLPLIVSPDGSGHMVVCHCRRLDCGKCLSRPTSVSVDGERDAGVCVINNPSLRRRCFSLEAMTEI